MLKENYNKLFNDLKSKFPPNRLFNDELNTLAYGTDASFYKLTPKIVVKAKSEEEVIFVINKCREFNIPITFRASGTSLSGQSISDSVLIISDRSWNKIKVSEDGSNIVLQPGVLGINANRALLKFNKKIGPDPASINAATVCGIVSNNASGMTSGTKFNAYNTIKNVRIVFANGNVLDTANSDQQPQFIRDNEEFIANLLRIKKDLHQSKFLTDKINEKYKIKNTMGYGVNSLIDFSDPFEIIKHLIIGSEGTLGFISEVTLNTVDSYPNKATSLIIFPSISAACSVIPILNELPIDAAELMDRASLKSVEDKKGMPIFLKSLDENCSALLIETSALNFIELGNNIEKIKSALKNVKTILPIEFTTDKIEYTKLWNVRKGLFTSVSKSRRSGTTVIIEDINFKTGDLANAVNDLQLLFKNHQYFENIIWGHALSGNIHFVLSIDFNQKNEIERYNKFMNDVVELVIKKYNGSLKAEHGTGRNMAPFVKYEWGDEIFSIMKQIKKIFDPLGILNPGVLINDDSNIHLKNLKPTPIVNDIIDKCIECGFCENNCPSKNLTLTPRQRISVWREIHKSKSNNEKNTLVNNLYNSFKYYGDETCATDGLCELSCPVDIDTGRLIKEIRNSEITKEQSIIAEFIQKHFAFVVSSIKISLKFAYLTKSIFGNNALVKISTLFNRITNKNIPIWIKEIPPNSKINFKESKHKSDSKKVVYFPSCISRTFGNQISSEYKEELGSVMEKLLNKAGYEIYYPENLNSLCCGMPFSSKGFFNEGDKKNTDLISSLMKSSANGSIPIIFDTSPCAKTTKDKLELHKEYTLKIYDSIEFIHDFLLDELDFSQSDKPITVHSTCSATKMELQEKLITIAKRCSSNVYVPEEINCCGFAGDRGFTFPELNESALNGLEKFVSEHNCKNGYSTSKACEIGLTKYSGINYQSIVFLVDECTQTK